MSAPTDLQRGDRLQRRERVAALVHTSSEWTRQVLFGVAEYAAAGGGWDLWIEPRGFYENPRLPADWHGDGLICRMSNPEVRAAVERAGVPAVNVSWAGGHRPNCPQVASDEVACGRMAAEFYLSRGFTRFGFVGPPPGQDYTDAVERGFRVGLGLDDGTGGGRTLAVFPHPPASDRLHLGAERDRFLDWLSELPKPVALLVWTTNIAHEIVCLCRDAALRGGRGTTAAADLRVPDRVAVLAVEFDPLLSALSPIPLAYIDQSPRQVGRRAAELLEAMMLGAPPPETPILIPPRRVAERLSVDAMLEDDPEVRRAIAWIRAHVGQPIDAAAAARAVGLSRATLERRFKQALGSSPAREIRRTKLSLARHLLGETALTVAEIADRTGFLHTETFARFFKRESGQTPGAFRRRPD
ncbi:xylose operon transcription regulator XylR [Alienimonas chondri]|uniref:Xylose operon regulatory protein n=1 Tax=Alienimonas chondri TaxID=2681879 RepID=A0ABX1VBB9_9PLAN|nr:DNA-binding transcriptional regulator [Alienimonas chondri]NNJ25405.1 Xylose operon regulatory protein [Alienimonas chondri]